MNAMIAALFLALWSYPADTSQADALIKAGHFKQAKTLLETAYRSNPKDARTLYLLARVRNAFGDRDGALQLAEQAVAIDGGNADYHYQVASISGDMAQNAGMFQKMSLGRRFKSEAETALKLDPKHVNARVGLMFFYMQAPGLIGGDKKKAHDLVDEIIRQDPVEGYIAQAQISRMEKNPAGVEAAYLKAVESNPQSYAANTAVANYYAADAQKKYDLAEKYARAAIKIDPSRGGAYAVLATVFAQIPRLTDLDQLLEQSARNVPDNLNPFYQAGRILLLAGRELPRAESYFRRYLAQEPEGGSPDIAATHWRLGLVLEKLGRKQEAVAEVEKAVQLRSNFDDAKKDLKRMKSL